MELAVALLVFSIVIIAVVFVFLCEDEPILSIFNVCAIAILSLSILSIGKQIGYEQSARGHNPLKMEIHYKYDKDSILISCDTITVKK